MFKRKQITIYITVTALLSAFSVVLAFVAKGIFGTQPLRLTVEALPIFIGATAFGPVTGMLVGVIADLLSCLLSGMAPLPLVTVGAGCIGIISGITYKLLPKNKFTITFSVFAGHAAGSMCIKTIALYGFYGKTALLRIPLYIGIAALESIILTLMFRRKEIKDILKKAGGFKNEL